MSVNKYTASTGTLTPVGGVPYETLTSLSSNIADDFDATKAYSSGEIVKYTDNLTYVCITDTTAGTLPTNTTYWTRKSLGEAIADKRDSALSDRVDAIGDTVGDSNSGLVKSVADIQGVIPDTASPSNMLATMANLGGSNIEHFVDENIGTSTFFNRANVECELTDFVLFTLLQAGTLQAYYFMLPVYALVNMIDSMTPNANNGIAIMQRLYSVSGQNVAQYLYRCIFYKDDTGSNNANATYYDTTTKTLYITFTEDLHSGVAKLDGYLIKCR